MLRKYSQRSVWSCIKFQLWTWQFDLRHWPLKRYYQWKLDRLMKKDPEEFARRLKLIEDWINEEIK